MTIYDRSGKGTVLPARGKRIRGLYWSPRGRWLLANAAGPTLLLIDPNSGEVSDLTRQFAGLQDAKLTVSWAPDETEALVAEGWNTVDQSNVWLLIPETKSVRPLTTAAKLEQVQWLQGGKGVLEVSAGCCGPMNLFIRLSDGTPIQGEEFHGGGSYAPDARRFMPAPYMGASLTIRDVVTHKSQTFWRDVPPGAPPLQDETRYRIYPGLWSPDSRYIAYVIELWAKSGPGSKLTSQTLRVVDVRDGSQLELVRGWAPSMEWLPRGNGLLFASKGDDGLKVHLGSRVLSTHQGGATLGIDSPLLVGVISPDNSRLAYAVSYASGASQLFVVNLTAGQATAVPDSTDLSPLMWTADGSQLLVAHMPVTRVRLPAGGEATGREATRLQLVKVQQLITKEAALAVAQKLVNIREQVTWQATFDPEREIYTKESGSKTYTVWVVEAIHAAGNKTVVFVDAWTGNVLTVGQVEAR